MPPSVTKKLSIVLNPLAITILLRRLLIRRSFKNLSKYKYIIYLIDDFVNVYVLDFLYKSSIITLDSRDSVVL